MKKPKLHPQSNRIGKIFYFTIIAGIVFYYLARSYFAVTGVHNGSISVAGNGYKSYMPVVSEVAVSLLALIFGAVTMLRRYPYYWIWIILTFAVGLFFWYTGTVWLVEYAGWSLGKILKYSLGLSAAILIITSPFWLVPLASFLRYFRSTKLKHD